MIIKLLTIPKFTMKKIIILIPLLISFLSTAQSTLIINSLTVSEVDPIKRGGTFNFEIKYQADGPINAKVQFWMAFFNNKEYDAWFINQNLNSITVIEGEENKEKTISVRIKFPEEMIKEEYKPNGFGKHNNFKIKQTSKLRKGEDYQLRIYSDVKGDETINKIIDATSPKNNTNIKTTFVQERGTGSCFFAIPNIIKIK